MGLAGCVGWPTSSKYMSDPIPRGPVPSAPSMMEMHDSPTVLGKGMDQMACAETEEKRKNTEAIIQGLLHKRTEWRGNAWLDYLFFLKQKHVIIGMFLCHRMHPFTQAERFSANSIHTFAGFGFALLFSPREGDSWNTRQLRRVEGFIIGILLTIGNLILVQAAQCSCVQEGTCLYRRFGDSVKMPMERWGRWIHCIAWVFAICVLVIGLLGDVPVKSALPTFIHAKVYSWLFGLAIDSLMFFVYYRGCCCCPGEVGPDGHKSRTAYPHGPQYPTDMDLFQMGDRCSGQLTSKSKAPSNSDVSLSSNRE